MYTNLTCQDVSFTVVTLSNILNDKHIPQKMQHRFVTYSRRGQKSVLKSLSDERAFLSCAALQMLVKICLTKQEKRRRLAGHLFQDRWKDQGRGFILLPPWPPNCLGQMLTVRRKRKT